MTDKEVALEALKKHQKLTDIQIGELEREIEAEEVKLELRAGDYGYITDALNPSNSDSFVISGFDGNSVRFTEGNRSGTCKMVIEQFRKRIIVILGNIFDDLKAISEPLDKFEMANEGLYSLTCEGMGHFIRFEDAVGAEIEIHHNVLPEFILNLRRMEYGLREKSVE